MRDILDIVNGTGQIEIFNSFYKTFGKLLSFCQLYDFLKKHEEYSYNKDIPHGFAYMETFKYHTSKPMTSFKNKKNIRSIYV